MTARAIIKGTILFLGLAAFATVSVVYPMVFTVVLGGGIAAGFWFLCCAFFFDGHAD